MNLLSKGLGRGIWAQKPLKIIFFGGVKIYLEEHFGVLKL